MTPEEYVNLTADRNVCSLSVEDVEEASAEAADDVGVGLARHAVRRGLCVKKTLFFSLF